MLNHLFDDRLLNGLHIDGLDIFSRNGAEPLVIYTGLDALLSEWDASLLHNLHDLSVYMERVDRVFKHDEARARDTLLAVGSVASFNLIFTSVWKS